MNKSSLGATNWTMSLSAYITSFDALALQPWSGGYIYVASASSSEIVVVNPATQTVVRTFTTAIPPNNLAVNPSGGNLYITNTASNFVYAYSPTGSLVWISPNLGAPVYSIAAPRDIVGTPLTSVVSRMTHGSAGMLDVNLPLIGTRGVESRNSASLGAGNYTLIFTFPNNLTSVANASVTTGTGSVSTSSIGPNPNQYTVNLSGVSDQQYIVITLHTVQDSAGDSGDVVGPQMGVLIGDTNADGLVNSGDISQTKSQSGIAIGRRERRWLDQ
jgi:YVTN family beta-propeller protein